MNATATQQVGSGPYARAAQVIKIDDYAAVIEANGTVREGCRRCDHYTGFIGAYAGIYAGECFECRGVGTVSKQYDNIEAFEVVVARRVKSRERAAAKRDVAAAKAVAANDAKRAAWVTANADIAAKLDAVNEAYCNYMDGTGPYPNDSNLITEMASEAAYKGLSDGQTAAVVKAFADEAARDAAHAKQEYIGNVGDKVTVEGVVEMVHYIAGDWNRSSTNLIKINVDGNMVKMFTAAAWSDDVEVNDTIKITATVKEHSTYDGAKETLVKAPRIAK